MYRKRCCYLAIFIMLVSLLYAEQAWAITWSSDLDSALKEAKKRQVPVMADFYTAWCHWCKELDRNTYSDSKVNGFSVYFICVKIDAEKNITAANKYGITGYPTVIFFNHDGSVNSRITGYRPPEVFAKSMEAILRNAGKMGDDAVPVKKDDMELSGIIINRQKEPVAVINNSFVKVGDTIGKGKVSKITKDKVEVLVEDKVVTLTID